MLKCKGKHTLHKSHVLLTAVEFATLESFRSRSWVAFTVLCTEEGVEPEAVLNHSFAQSKEITAFSRDYTKCSVKIGPDTTR